MPVEIGAAALSTDKQFRVARLGLREPALGPGHLPVDLGRRPPDLLVRALEQLGQRQLDVCRHAVSLGEPVAARLIEEGRECLRMAMVLVATKLKIRQSLRWP